MKSFLMAFCAILLCFAAFAGEVKVTSVTAQQRYPWNGLVDITVTLQGTADDIADVMCSFAATNSATKAGLPFEHITRNGADSSSGTTWTRKYIWDAKADVGAVKIENVALTVDVELSYVQLWENGPYWAKCNVGSEKPEGYGYYFWWGDAIGHKRNAANDGWESVQYGTSFSFLYYNCPTYGMNSSQLQSVGYIDSTGNLVAAHDAATAHLGAPWRMPTRAEFDALLSNCTKIWTTRNGVYGRLVAGKGAYASKSIFLPAAGYGGGSSLDGAGSIGNYWSSTPYLNSSQTITTYYAWCIGFNSLTFRLDEYSRFNGQSVRPVRGFVGAVSSGSVTSGGNAVVSHLSLDCREVRVADAVEMLYYSSAWATEDQSAVAEIAVNGEVINRASDSGAVEWVPTKDGVCNLTHTVKVNGVQVGKVLPARFAVGNAPLIAENGVLIGYNGEVPEELVIPDGVKSIAGGAFAACKTLKSLTIPSSVTAVGNNAFNGCDNLETVYVAAGDIDRVRNLVKGSGFDISEPTYIDANGDTFAAFTIKRVDAQQRYPWNGLVDITVTLQGTADDIINAECFFAATNSATKAALPVLHIKQNGADSGSGTTWTRKYIWDTNADLGEVVISDVALAVDAKVIGRVQLWEGGPYWAECNVGATKPEEYGYYFWWGDTVGYKRNVADNEWVSVKDGSSFTFGKGTCPTYGKSNSELQSVGDIDTTGNLVAAHDAATAHLGAPWRMPTDAEFSALIRNCTTTWEINNGVWGCRVTGKGAYASKSIFLPAAGADGGSSLDGAGSNVGYWSSTPHSDFHHLACYLYFDSDYFRQRDGSRSDGRSVRPVRGSAQ